MLIAVHPEILSSLASVREDVQCQVERLDHFRAVKAIEQTIAEFPGLNDLARSLTDVRDRVQQQLSETREYRALRAVEKMMPELTEVLTLLSERAVVAPVLTPAKEEDKASAIVSASREEINVAPFAPLAVEDDTFFAIETDATISSAEPALFDERPAVADASDAMAANDGDIEVESFRGETADPADTIMDPQKPQNVSSSPTGEGAPASSLAYSLAQLMVQALVPPPSTPPEGADGEKKETSEIRPASGPFRGSARRQSRLIQTK